MFVMQPSLFITIISCVIYAKQFVKIAFLNTNENPLEQIPINALNDYN